MERDKAYSVIIQALGCLYKRDKNLFCNNEKNYERAIAFRLAHYIANIIEDDRQYDPSLSVDSEYERHIESPKACFDGCSTCLNGTCFITTERLAILNARKKARVDASETETELIKEVGVRPDIIVHERKTKTNFMVIEVKSPNNNELTERPDIIDAAKLTYMTCPRPEESKKYHYDLGIALCVVKDKAKIWTFIDGENQGSFTVPFMVNNTESL